MRAGLVRMRRCRPLGDSRIARSGRGGEQDQADALDRRVPPDGPRELDPVHPGHLIIEDGKAIGVARLDSAVQPEQGVVAAPKLEDRAPHTRRFCSRITRLVLLSSTTRTRTS